MKKKETKKNNKTATKTQKAATAQKQTKSTAKKQQNKPAATTTKKSANKPVTQKDLDKSMQNFLAVKSQLKSGDARNIVFKKPMKFFREHSVEEAVTLLKKEAQAKQTQPTNNKPKSQPKATSNQTKSTNKTMTLPAPRKTANKSATTAPSTTKKQPTTKRPAKNASNRKQSAKKSKKQGEGEKPSHPQGEQRKSSVGEIHRGNTKYIDTEPKEQRDYAVVKDNNGKVTVAKVKSIKEFDENGKNADPALVEINHERYGLEKRSGVDFETFDQNRMTHKPLQLSDKDVFPEEQPRATMGSHDKHRVLQHVKTKGKKKK